MGVRVPLESILEGCQSDLLVYCRALFPIFQSNLRGHCLLNHEFHPPRKISTIKLLTYAGGRKAEAHLNQWLEARSLAHTAVI